MILITINTVSLNRQKSLVTRIGIFHVNKVGNKKQHLKSLPQWPNSYNERNIQAE